MFELLGYGIGLGVWVSLGFNFVLGLGFVYGWAHIMFELVNKVDLFILISVYGSRAELGHNSE